MKKVGIISYHYSNNYGGVLQNYALYNYINRLGYEVETINYVQSYVNLKSIFYNSGLRKNIIRMIKEGDFNLKKLSKRLYVKSKYNDKIISKFDEFRNDYCRLSVRVDEKNIYSILQDYEAIIVGSDQVWSPGARSNKVYFLDFGDCYNGLKFSYAADSTTSEVDSRQKDRLKTLIEDFDAVSVRNQHSFEFVKRITGKEVSIVVDPTLLIDFSDITQDSFYSNYRCEEKYILVYVLGNELSGSNREVINKIKKKYGNIKVYAVIIPTMKFNMCNYADKVLYDLGPIEWLNMIKNATFILTDSFHGTLFSIKFRRPFLAYYTEKLRSTRFEDLGKRYGIDEFIVSDINEIDKKNSLDKLPDFNKIEEILLAQQNDSIGFLHEILKYK
jgi:hypothetical protein